jgi:hypothetical protein
LKGERRAGLAERPDWLSPLLLRPLVLRLFRLSTGDVATIVSLWEDAESRAGMTWPTELVTTRAAEILRALPHTTAWELLSLAFDRQLVARGLTAFLPAGFELPDRSRRLLYFQALLVVAMASMSRQGPTKENGVLVDVVRGAAALFGSAAIDAETGRRCEAHVGSAAGLLLAVMGLKRAVPEEALPSDESTQVVAALEGLRKAVRRIDRPRVLKGVVRAGDWEEANADIRAQILLTLEARWGQLHPLDALALGLDGRLDIAPRAVYDDLIDRGRQSAVREKFEVLFWEREPTVPVSGPEDPRADSWEPSATAWQPDEEAAMDELLARLSGNPAVVRYLLAAFNGEAQIEVAARLKVSDRTVRNLHKRFRELLGQ